MISDDNLIKPRHRLSINLAYDLSVARIIKTFAKSIRHKPTLYASDVFLHSSVTK